MTHQPEDPEHPVDPFPADFAPPSPSRFPPVGQEATVAAEPVATPPQSDWIAAADAHDMPVTVVREGRLKRLGRLAFPPEDDPGDADAMAARDRRWASRVVVVVALFMAVFNAASIQNWARQQAPGWFSLTVQQMADVWTAQLAQLGADQPRQGVRDAYGQAHDARFPGQAPPS